MEIDVKTEARWNTATNDNQLITSSLIRMYHLLKSKSFIMHDFNTQIIDSLLNTRMYILER